LVQDLPEIARRYFNHAIAAGAPLKNVIKFEMEGTFVPGDKDNQQFHSITTHPGRAATTQTSNTGRRIGVAATAQTTGSIVGKMEYIVGSLTAQLD
jgi:hypothetical protein